MENLAAPLDGLTNWAGNHAYGAAHLFTPESVEQLQEIVRGSRALRVLGSRHSFNDIADSTGSLILRYPLELGSFCIAPYALGGGGVQTGAGSTLGSVHAGAGLEWRATPKLGIYSEGRYTWTTEHAEESTQVRLGVRFVF